MSATGSFFKSKHKYLFGINFKYLLFNSAQSKHQFCKVSWLQWDFGSQYFDFGSQILSLNFWFNIYGVRICFVYDFQYYESEIYNHRPSEVRYKDKKPINWGGCH